MKQVRETKAGRSISAFVVLKRDKLIAKVQFYYSDSGNVTCDVWDWIGNSELQQGRVGGYGYDKAAAAIRGCVIDGHVLFDHCGQDKRTEKILNDYTSGKITEEKALLKAGRIGASFANYCAETKKFKSLYYPAGLELLRKIGYTVIQAI